MSTDRKIFEFQWQEFYALLYTGSVSGAQFGHKDMISALAMDIIRMATRMVNIGGMHILH